MIIPLEKIDPSTHKLHFLPPPTSILLLNKLLVE